MKLTNHSILFGSIFISALHYQPECELKSPFLIYSHGFTSCKHSMDGLASYLAMKGFAGLTYDAIGHKLGGTGGELHSIDQLVESCGTVAEFARHELRAENIVLLGHSMGAMVSLEQAFRQQLKGQQIGGVVSMALGAKPARGFHSPVGQTMLRQREDYISGAAAFDLILELDRWCLHPPKTEAMNMLFIAAKGDVLIPVERVQILAELCGSNVDISVVDSSHLDAPDRSRSRIYDWLLNIK